MQPLVDFFNHPFFIILGGLTTLFSLVVLVVTIYTWSKGIFPVWWRLGIGLSKRKIAIFAENEFHDLKKMLIDSRLFQEPNIVQIGKRSIGSAKGLSLFLIHWKAFENDIDEILKIKEDPCALIVYAPQDEGGVPPEAIKKLNNKRNVILVNFRGRLLNDILTCMITTSFEKK